MGWDYEMKRTWKSNAKGLDYGIQKTLAVRCLMKEKMRRTITNGQRTPHLATIVTTKVGKSDESHTPCPTIFITFRKEFSSGGEMQEERTKRTAQAAHVSGAGTRYLCHHIPNNKKRGSFKFSAKKASHFSLQILPILTPSFKKNPPNKIFL